MKRISDTELKELNKKFKEAKPGEIISWANMRAKSPVVTTNFRPYEAAIIYACNSVKPDIKIIWCDTGYNTPQTYKHAKELIDSLKLNIFLYTPVQTAAYRDAINGGIPSIDSAFHAEFTKQVKLEPFQRAMAEHQPDVWFTNLRKGQTSFRDSIDILSYSKDGVLKVSPFYHYSDNQLDEYLKDNELPNEFKYFDPTKVLDNRECGLHA
ncbi:phosphoadenylylsulfate reductase [Gramella sp. BOM4]|nr:phosphoadenylylsulfate reductase [Christiangramia bathymodioli]